MLTENLIKCELSIAYLHTIATKLGFELERNVIDNDSVDVTVSANGEKLDPESILHSPKLDIQLKATTNWELKDGKIYFDLSPKNLLDLTRNCAVPKILVVLCLPKESDNWISISVEEIIIRKCAYWINIKGQPIVEGSGKRVYLQELLTPQSLYDILVKISKQAW
jgi:hypothetical protein